jgi:hypothetical protein
MPQALVRQSISVAHERLQFLLHRFDNNQKKLAKKLGVSTALISLAKANKSFRPRKKIREAIDSLYERESVLWSQELEALGRQVDAMFAKVAPVAMDDSDEKPTADDVAALWLPITAVVRLAIDDWSPIVRDEASSILARLFFARTVDFVLTKFAHGLDHMPEMYRSLSRVSAEAADALADETGKYLTDLLSRHGIEDAIIPEAKRFCAAPKVALQLIRAKTWLGKLVRDYYGDDLSGEPFKDAIKKGFLDDCLTMANIHRGDPAWPNIRWQVAARAAHWEHAAELAAFLSRSSYNDILLHGLFDVDPLVTDPRSWPGLAAALAYPNKPGLADLLQRLNHTQHDDVRFAEMVRTLHRMKDLILQKASTYAEVMAVLGDHWLNPGVKP